MLTEDIKQEIRGSLAKIAGVMPAFKARPGQRLMIAEVARAFAACQQGKSDKEKSPVNTGSTFVCVNGGTGIGKSLAYVLPGALIARRREKKLVISSSTVALQEQLVRKDLPLFLPAAGVHMKYELAKGRTRFVCEHKLRRVIEDMRQLGMFPGNSLEDAPDGHIEVYETLLNDFESGQWDGDRDTIERIDDAQWSTITTDRHGCLSRRCPNYKSCAQMKARQRLKDADIIVANHDLVLSDLASGGGAILPKPEDCLYVFDEAHHLPEKAVGAFSSSHMIGSLAKLLDRMDGLPSLLRQAMPGDQSDIGGEIADAAGAMREGLLDAQSYFGSLHQLIPTKDKQRPMLEFERSMIPDEIVSVGENIIASARTLLDRLGAAADMLSERLDGEKLTAVLAEKILGEIGLYEGRVEEAFNTWTLFLDEPSLDAAPIAKWVEAIPHRSGNGVELQICASPVVASGYLRSLLWERAAGATLCSATITTLGNFDDFLARTGLVHFPETACADVPSPFDYSTQGLLVIPPLKASPKDVTAHTGDVVVTVSEEMVRLTGEGMLVLFTSRRQMDEVTRQLPPALRQLVQVQGETSKTKILDTHRERIDRGEPSVIFGMESFSEGVDLVGKYCTVLIITKLPFQAPDNPVLRTHSEWIDRRGGNSFMQLSVPDAARKLEQRVGRLIRTESDNGRVVVLDTRLWTTRFGRLILRGLPPFRIMAMGKEVTA